MAQPAKPLRADAARNRARVLETAYETFAAEGLSVPIDEIARRAGVGAGTVYRHFPTKEALFQAVIRDRTPHLDGLDELLGAAQKAGTARRDIGVREVKSILVGCQAMEAYNPALAEQVTDVVIDGLRVQR